MSKSREPRNNADSSAARDAAGGDSAQSAGVNDHQPFKPQRGLFILLALVLIALFAGFLTLYFKTVYPAEKKTQSAHLNSALK
jgi:hypothetical protein